MTSSHLISPALSHFIVIAGRVLLATGLVVGIAALLLFLFQRQLIYHPRRYDVSPEALLRSHLAEGRARILTFEIDGHKQHAYYLMNTDASSTSPLCIFLGGNASLALDFLDYAEVLLLDVRGVLLVDYPGYGMNEGRPSRRGIRATVQRAFEELAAMLGENPAQLAPKCTVVGISLGCAATLELAQNFKFRRLILLAPFSSMLDMARRAVGWPFCHLLIDRFDNRAALAHLAKANDPPTVIIYHGDADDLVPVTMSRELAQLYPSIVRCEEIRGADHATILDQAFPRIMEIFRAD